MIQKSIFIISLIVFTLVSCKPKIVEQTISTFPDGSVKKSGVFEVKGKDSVLIKETLFFENGAKKLEGTYKNGVKDGSWTSWYSNGNLWSKGEFANGHRTGATTVYHQDGTLNYTGAYKNGKPDGEWKIYANNEDVAKIITYKEGKIVNQENLQVPFK